MSAPSQPGFKAPHEPPPYYGEGGTSTPVQVGYVPTQATPVQQQPGPGVTVVSTPAVVIQTGVPLGRQSASLVCPTCHVQVHTVVKKSPSTMAWIAGGFICLVGCWCGCCLIPCFMDDLQDVEHSCPNCKNFIGTYHR